MRFSHAAKSVRQVHPTFAELLCVAPTYLRTTFAWDINVMRVVKATHHKIHASSKLSSESTIRVPIQNLAKIETFQFEYHERAVYLEMTIFCESCHKSIHL